MNEALGSIPNTAQAGCGDTHPLSPQWGGRGGSGGHLGVGGHIKKVSAQPGLHEIPVSNNGGQGRLTE